jgi:hypothetical protein
MKLSSEGVNKISPTGETLTVGVRANYTVSKRQRLGSLKIYNSICQRENCPLIVTRSANQSISDYNFNTVCGGLDAGSGCSIVNPNEADWDQGWRGDFNALNDPSDGDESDAGDTEITKGEVAVQVGGTYGGLDKDRFNDIAADITRDKQEAGNDPDQRYEPRKLGVLYYEDFEEEREMEIVELNDDCKYQSSYPESEMLWKNCQVDPNLNDGKVGWMQIFPFI